MLQFSLREKKEEKEVFAKKSDTGVRDPYKRWMFLIKMFSLAVILLLAASVYIYYRTDAKLKSITTQGATSTKSPINTEKLDAVLELFNKKSQRYSELKAATPSIVDPSL